MQMIAQQQRTSEQSVHLLTQTIPTVILFSEAVSCNAGFPAIGVKIELQM